MALRPERQSLLNMNVVTSEYGLTIWEYQYSRSARNHIIRK